MIICTSFFLVIYLFEVDFVILLRVNCNVDVPISCFCTIPLPLASLKNFSDLHHSVTEFH